jgi:glucose-6-phosphate isomerase
MNKAPEQPYGVTSKNYPEFMARCSEHIVRKGKDMAGYFQCPVDSETVIYEVYEADCAGNTCTALTILKPGKVGTEYYMTKGHFHEDAESGETYVCLKGKGMVIMQTRDGATDEIILEPGTVACIPPGWAHRTINIGKEEFVMLAIFPSCSGHDYASIQEKGFLKRVVEKEGKLQII